MMGKTKGAIRTATARRAAARSLGGRPPRRSVAAAVCVALTAAALVALPVDASPLFELVGDTLGTSGQAARTTVRGASSASTYFNPALLPFAPRGVTTGIAYARERIAVSLDDRPAGADVPEGLRGGNHEGTYVRDGVIVVSPTVDPTSLPTAWLEQGCATCAPAFAARPRGADASGDAHHAYAGVGLVQPLFGDRLVLGMHALIPLGEFTAAHAYFVDEREQFFSNSLHPEMYGDRMKATSIAFGVGAPISDKLTVGLSATIALRNSATAATYVSDSDNQAQTLLLSTDVSVRARIAPHFGVSWQPTNRVSFAAAVHSPQRFDIETGFSAALPDGNEQFASRAATHDYLPWQVSAGAEVLLVDCDARGVAVTAAAKFARWNRYIDRQSERALQGYEWADTLSPTVGARVWHGDWKGWADATMVPTPVPLQTGRSNYVDNDRVGGALGIERRVELRTTVMRVGANAQLHGLLRRHQTKRATPTNPIAWPGDDRFGDAHYPSLVVDEVPDDVLDGGSIRPRPLDGREGLQTNNPGFPGFSSGGVVAGAGVSIAFEY